MASALQPGPVVLAHARSTDGTDPAAQFLFYKCATDNPLPGEPAPGEPFIMKSLLTGKYCRTAPILPAGTPPQDGILCDMDQPNLASCYGFDCSSNSSCTMVTKPGGDNITSPPECPSCPLCVGGWQ